MLEVTGGEALIRALAPEGLSTIYGLTGGKLSGLMQAIAARPEIRFIGARHEGGASLMAAGHAVATGQLGVVIGECGSGAVNLVPGIAVANANSVPLLAVTSNNQHYVSYPARAMFAGMDTEALMRPVTRWNVAVHDGRRIPELVRAALREALSGRRGAVHLDVPQDILRATFAYDEREFARTPADSRVSVGPAATDAQLSAAVELLMTAERPLFIAGGGVIQSGATESFRELVAAVGAATAATQTALGVVPSNDRHYIGHATVTGGPAFIRACREADVVLAVGCRFSSWLWDDNGPLVSPSARVIHVTTDASALGRDVATLVPMHADANLALRGLLTRLGQPTRARAAPWLAMLRALRDEHAASLATIASDTTLPLHPAALAARLAALIPESSIVTYDGGHTTFWSNDYTPALAPRTRLNEVGMTQLGFGLPFAMAAKAAHADVPVFNITGDGAFGFTIQELDTARRYGLPVINIVHNNAAWGIIRHAHQRGFGFTMGDDLAGTDYAAIARGFGCFGEVVTELPELAGAIERALASGLPAVIDCRVRFVPHPGLPDFGRMGAVGLTPTPGPGR